MIPPLHCYHLLMDSTAGFVLTGGRSSRRGRDKALLRIEGSLLAERTNDVVRAGWNLVIACFAPQTGSVYYRREGDAVEFAIQHKRFKMHDLLKSLRAVSWPVSDASLLESANTPLEWGTR